MTQQMVDPEQLEVEIQRFGTEIFQEVQSTALSVFDPQFYTGKLMDWSMKEEEFKISLSHFVDVLPSLTSASEIVRHVQEYFRPVAHKIPGLLKWGLDVSPDSLPAKVAAQVVKKQIRSMAERFIAGESPKTALKALKKVHKSGAVFTVDLLGEATLSEIESESYLQRYLELLDALDNTTPSWPKNTLNISVKLSALYSQTSPLNHKLAVETLSEKLGVILSRAKSIGAFMYVDMEDTSLVDITLDTFKTLLLKPEFKDYPNCGIVLQAYLRRSEKDLDELIEWSKKRGTPVAVRLVKGAYWDTETILAKQHSWPIPVWQEKSASDACYERMTRTLLENHQHIFPAFGSHNIRSLVHATTLASMLGLDKSQFELQVLFGMAEPIERAFVKRGFTVREYVPVGELIPGMGYLVRRLLENTSNEGFLRLGFHEHETPELLLAAPNVQNPDNGEEHINRDPTAYFTNSPLRDFSIKDARESIAKEINTLKSKVLEIPISVNPIVEGESLSTSTSIASCSPEDTSLKLADVGLASIADSEKAVSSLDEYFSTWRDTKVEERTAILYKTAELFEKHRDELIALVILEAGKPWAEADADIAEAIDFLNYYATEASIIFEKKKLGHYPGEENSLFYEPRGITLVISPWNFPAAIPVGMFSAALVTGNCAILKPAEQTSLIAYRCFQLFLEAGLPPRAAAFLPGIGEEIGAYLSEHAAISTIAFTGSKEVGLKILATAAKVVPGQTHIKRTIIEMGGKNAIIVDSDADLDEAVAGVLYSAFGFQGQKCSACSRVIVLDSVYDKFNQRLKEAAKDMLVGLPSDSGTFVGPVIDEETKTRLMATIAETKQNCNLLLEREIPAAIKEKGNFVTPSIFVDVDPAHKIFQEELFGPILAVTRAENFEQALELALNSEYGLTGGLFSRSPEHIKQATEKFRVGNLYLNRGCTGALVLRQPFGGAKMSGVGSKAGGPDYLPQFLIPRAISENTMRRGFAPI